MPEVGPGSEVIADVRAEEGPAAPVRYADVVVTHPIHCLAGRQVCNGPGIAAAREERNKFEHYRPRPGGRAVLTVPLSFETYGRWGKHAALELRRLARKRSERADAQRSVDPKAVYRSCLRRWRQEVSVALQLGNFAIYNACAPIGVAGVLSHLPPDEDGSLASLICDFS